MYVYSFSFVIFLFFFRQTRYKILLHAHCLVLVIALVLRVALASCPIRDQAKTDVVIFHDKGVGDECRDWEMHFYTWMNLRYAVINGTHLQDPGCGGMMKQLGVKIFAMPGGGAYRMQSSVGAAGKSHILHFRQSGGTYVGTCAGFYFASTNYFWQIGSPGGGNYTHANLLGLFPSVEGSITTIQDYDIDPYWRLTIIDDVQQQQSLQALYWGGPTRGWRSTPTTATPGPIKAWYTAATPNLPAVYALPRLALFSVHLEAEEGVGIHGTGLTKEMVLANWKFRAQIIHGCMEDDVATAT